MGVKCIVGGDIFTPLEIIPRGTILIENNFIEAIGPVHEIALPENCEIFEAHGQRVLPGLIDLHVHGLMGIDVVDANATAIPGQLARFGVTAFQATVPAGPLDEMTRAIASVCRLKDIAGARFVGVHLEGPYLSPLRPGALNRNHFRRPDVAELAKLVDVGGGSVCTVTLAPELEGAFETIAWLAAAGIVPAIGHSDASYEEVNRAVEVGLCYATHTFDAMRGFHHRHPGTAGAVLTHDAIVAEVIGDGVHVHPAAVSLLLRSKGPQKVCLASDASPLAGLPVGTYEWLGQSVVVDARSARLEDGTLAGATSMLNQQLAFLEKCAIAPYQQLVEMATRTPSNVLDLGRGLLAVGRHADIAIFDSQHRCRLTMVDGEVVHLS